MSKKRTKKQKLKATKRRKQSLSLVLEDDQAAQTIRDRAPALKLKKLKLAPIKEPSVAEVDLFRYDRKLIYRDLIKSLLITLLFFALLWIIYLSIK